MESKLVIMDLDGVLISSKEIHYESLNKALREISEEYVISIDEHLSKFDGLSTTKKLDMLTETRGLPKSLHGRIWERKQYFTEQLLLDTVQESPKLIDICEKLKERGFKIAVASNAIRNTVKTSLLSLGIIKYVDYYASNEDVKRTKPFPEIYWSCMIMTNTIPKNTVIIEDSHIGRQGAIASGANLLAVENPDDLTWKKLEPVLKTIENQPKINIPWIDKRLTVLIPMAGAGSRFSQAGYTFPKPLIDVMGKPMIQLVVENLNIIPARFVFLVQKEHYEKYDLKNVLSQIVKNTTNGQSECQIIQVNGLTEGAACTTLLASAYLTNNDPLLIANSDQYMDWNSNEVMYAFKSDNIDGGLLTFKSNHPKWSYARLGENGFVTEVAEKRVISDNATTGVYYWKCASDYKKYAEQMIFRDIRHKNEFYIAPVYNEAIRDGAKIKIKSVNAMFGIGTPEDLDAFLKQGILK